MIIVFLLCDELDIVCAFFSCFSSCRVEVLRVCLMYVALFSFKGTKFDLQTTTTLYIKEYRRLMLHLKSNQSRVKEHSTQHKQKQQE